ncbi:hypothetical protein ACET9J_19885 [Aeromonas veronii]
MIRSPYALKVPDLVNNALIDIIGGDMMKKATSMHLTRFYQQNMAAAPFCAPSPQQRGQHNKLQPGDFVYNASKISWLPH